MSHTIVLRLTSTEQREHVGRHSRERKTINLPTYAVFLDGEKIGTIERAMITRERRSPGLRYVNARWQSPGWQYRLDRGRTWEAMSRRDAIERLLGDFDSSIGFHEREDLAQKATVQR